MVMVLTPQFRVPFMDLIQDALSKDQQADPVPASADNRHADLTIVSEMLAVQPPRHCFNYTSWRMTLTKKTDLNDLTVTDDVYWFARRIYYNFS